MYDEDELLPISALQHLLYCERQCALIHLEQVWSENRLTAEGRILHERVDARGDETRRGVCREFGAPLKSRRLGLTGIADVVEYHVIRREVNGGRAEGGPQAFPVEYKRGKPKAGHADEVQLCAQALCLEEMLGGPVHRGALFYGKTRRRVDVEFDKELRSLTEDSAARLHALIKTGKMPSPVREAKCRNCSLRELCMPRTAGRGSASEYLQSALRDDDDKT